MVNDTDTVRNFIKRYIYSLSIFYEKNIDMKNKTLDDAIEDLEKIVKEMLK